MALFPIYILRVSRAVASHRKRASVKACSLRGLCQFPGFCLLHCLGHRMPSTLRMALASSAAGKRPRWRPPSVVDRQAALTTLDRVPPHDLRKTDDPSVVSKGVFLPRPAQLVSGHIGPIRCPLFQTDPPVTHRGEHCEATRLLQKARVCARVLKCYKFVMRPVSMSIRLKWRASAPPAHA